MAMLFPGLQFGIDTVTFPIEVGEDRRITVMAIIDT